MSAGAYEELHREAELQGLRVMLESDYERRPSRHKRVAVVDRDEREVAALRLTPARDLERASVAILAFLQARRAAETT